VTVEPVPEPILSPGPHFHSDTGALAIGGRALAQTTLPDVIAVVGMRFEARIIAGGSVRTVSRRSAESNPFVAAVEKWDRGVISFGICGGLAPDLRAGACIVASHVLDGARAWPTDKSWTAHLLRSIPEAIEAPILGVDAPVFQVEEKRSLYRRYGAAAVDMESHLAAAAASLHGLPFVAIRVIVDDARCELVSAALAGRQDDGSISAAAVFRALLGRPDEFGRLLILAAKARAALATLMRLRPLFADGRALAALAPRGAPFSDRAATEVMRTDPRTPFPPPEWLAER
jgi:hopanoid-associated phosphorylase